ncbi:PdxA family dehydrogenase [Mangrovicella endophytica]|uniref:PdxA family dehydrogenase n=1 Tax=Mangrovicella endophytica TaxID=2066697 RepID=UPI000C9DBFB2|nr:4-hydroxythreonine-4-phosphate dehydrogenase PdxA [Mangrovicella endophytica]
MNSPVIALTPGDCTGIGPEILAKILADRSGLPPCRLLVVGDRRVLELGARQAGVSLDIRTVASPREIDWNASSVPLIDLGNIDPALYPAGVVSSESGRLTGDTLARAIDLAKAGEVDAVSFAPLNKRAMYDGGWRFPDEHKMFAHLLGHTTYFSEMNVLDNQWMSRVTSHVSLRQAVDGVTGPAIRDAIRLSDRMMRKAGIAAPRIAVAALNPHGGENGLFGTEEIDIIRPAVEATAREDGIACEGPFPADTVYLKAFSGAYDGVVAMYHDQGQIATKLKGFNKGVTVTAGLDTVFTTPAHGTAFDIVGKGIAQTGAFTAAITLAANLAQRSS